MKKNFIVLCVILAAGVMARTQVYIQPTLPAAGLVQKSQLWNLVLINSTGALKEGRLDLVLRDRQTGTELMTASTGRFTLPKGSLTVTVNNLNPVQYNYLAMDPVSAMNSLLPAGSYTACYSFTQDLSGKQVQLAEECVAFDIEPLTPPMLIFPADSTEMESMPTQFTWTPPAPAGMISKLQYEILITELKPGQKPAEAMQDNMSFYNTAALTNNFISWSASFPSFEKDKWYCWQIVARDDKNYAGKSEVWVFKINPLTELEKIINGTPYIRMKPDMPETGIAPNSVLKLAFFSRANDENAKVIIYDMSSAGDKALATIPVKLTPGENQLQLNLKKMARLSEDNTYKAEIETANGERNSILFRVKNFENK